MRKTILSLTLLVLILVSTGCQAPPLRRQWSMSDLLLLDPVDSPNASTDILAVYLRTHGSDLEIRIDLLDLPLKPDYALSILLKTLRGDKVVEIPTVGQPVLKSPDPAWRIRITRDPWLDHVTIRFNQKNLEGPFSLLVTSRMAGQVAVEDETTLVTSGDMTTKMRVPVVIAFWNVYPAFSPAQVLRRWDGAHTGPFGGRHGLKHILDSVERYRVPVSLLDARTPASLAAMDYAGILRQVRRLQQNGDLLLPDAAYSYPQDIALAFSRDASQGFELPTSRFAFSPGVDVLKGYDAQFMSLPVSSHMAFNGRTRIIPLPIDTLQQATGEGPSLDVRRTLMATLFSEDDADLIVLGGSLPDSSWGDSDMAYPTFAWLAAHPWIWVMDQADLMTFPVTRRYLPPGAAAHEGDEWLDKLSAAPDNAITRSAWQMYLQYHVPTDDDRLVALRNMYIGQVGILLKASEWADRPGAISDCSTDPDRDGAPECLLADERFFACMELNGGRLSHLFYYDGTSMHQLIAPTVQYALGLSDPTQWRPEAGDAADPGAVMGAFSDADNPLSEYRIVSLSGGELVLSRLDGRISKVFSLSGEELQVTYLSAETVKTTIPLLADPQAYYFGHTELRAVSHPGSWSWGTASGAMAVVSSDAGLSAVGFNVSRISLGVPEDPNHFFPAGHYLPFPFSLVTLQGQGEFTTRIVGK